jgi:hypothetical protein
MRPPATNDPELAAAPRRRRWPWLGLAILVTIVLLVGSIWIANYVPLVQGSSGFGTLRKDVREIDVEAFDITGHVFEVPVGRLARFRYEFSIRNNGPFSVTIEDVGAQASGGSSRLGRRAIRVIPDAYEGPRSGYERWHPFSLAPGHEATIEMEAIYRGRCVLRNTAMSWSWEPVTYSILGIPRHDDVMVGVEVRFVGTGDC